MTTNNDDQQTLSEEVPNMAKAKKAAKKASVKASAKTSAKTAGKSAGKTSAKSASKKTAANTSAKSAAPKAAAKATSAKTSKKSAPKSAPKTSAKTAAPKTSAKKAAPKSKGTVAQVTDALMNVANKVTNAFTGGDTKKKVLKTTATAKLKASDVVKAFAPLDDRLVIERAEVSDRTAGGLYIPDTVSNMERPNRGTVLAVGPGHRDKKGRLRPLDVQQGDIVIFNPWSGSDIRLGDQDLVLVRESDIVAVVKE